ncbi:hypothetical protein EB796_005513 [Bugula neritina]|uniref:Caspase family p20 domain-containing protein n=1 Tax=Bugula neritina TaxID=10212 RepID=A0A7J7KEZ0_BUGNE|nr:hypothetical protein EB796_005513 [Bugula neritina]
MDNLERTVSELIDRRQQEKRDTPGRELLLNSNQSDLRTDEVTSEDDLSDLSDEDEYLYPEGGEGEQLKLIRLTPNRTTNPKIKKLFSNTDRVFSMTRERGRALIINNMNFDKRPDLCRQGSDGDTANMSAMLKDFKFDVVTHTDLKAEVYFYPRIDVGKKGIDPTSDLRETQLEDTEIVSLPLPELRELKVLILRIKRTQMN